MRKSANFVRLYFQHITTYIFRPNFGILLLLKGSFREFLDLSGSKISLQCKLSTSYDSWLSYKSFLQPNMQEWKDEVLNWNPADYGGIEEINIHSGYIWVPRLLLYNKYVNLLYYTRNISSYLT